MSIFRTEDCPICGRPTSPSKKITARYNGSFLCRDCGAALKAAGYKLTGLKKKPLEELQEVCRIVREKKEKIKRDMETFTITKQIGEYLYLDEKKRKVGIPMKPTGSKEFLVYDFRDILGCDITEETSTETSSGIENVGMAIAGEKLFGRAGAIALGTAREVRNMCSSITVVIQVGCIGNPYLTVSTYDGYPIDRQSGKYRRALMLAQEVAATLKVICRENERKAAAGAAQAAAGSDLSPADEIKKYKALLDTGAITEEEYEAKKKQLLEL